MAAHELILRWPEADLRGLGLWREAGVGALWLPWEAPGERRGFLAACREAGIRVMAEIEGPAGALPAQARAAGFGGVVVLAPEGERQVRELASGQRDLEWFVCLKPGQIHWRVDPAQAVLVAGLWPGSRRGDPALAGASQATWLDANSYLAAYLRGRFPERAAWLGYRPDEEAGVAKDQQVAYSSVELALAEAMAAGGNWVVTLPEHYRQALLAGEARAQAAWKSLARTARFLREHADTFRQPSAARVAAAVDALEDCAEILNLLFRHNVSPAVAPLDAIPPYGRHRILVAVGLARRPAGIKAALEFARAGGKVLAAPAAGGEEPWWRSAEVRRTGGEEGRDFYALGRGAIIAYREPVSDPGEFALDVIDALGWRTRDLRVWGANAIVGLLHRGAQGGLSVELLNYGGFERDFLVRVEGVFSRATLRSPEAAPAVLRAARRGSGTEVELARVHRVAGLWLA